MVSKRMLPSIHPLDAADESTFERHRLAKTALMGLLSRLEEQPVAERTPLFTQGNTMVTIAEACRDLRHVVAQDAFRVAVIGEYSTGKSSLLNVLLEILDPAGKKTEGILPTAMTATTAVITRLQHGERQRAELELKDGTVRSVELDELQAFLTTPELKFKWPWQRDAREKERLQADLKEIRIRLASPLLAEGIEILDTPGLGSVHAEHGEITRRCITNVDAALFLVTTDPPMGEAEMAFLQYVSAFTPKMLFVQTKWDLEREETGRQSLEENKGRIAEVVGHFRFDLHWVSALKASLGMRRSDPVRLAESGLPDLRHELEHFLVALRGAPRVAAWRQKASSFFDLLDVQLRNEQSLLEQRLTSQTHLVPAEASLDGRAIFEAFRDVTQAQLKACCDQVSAMNGRLVKDVLDDVLPEFRKCAAESVARSRDVRARLERYLIEALQRHSRRAFDPIFSDAVEQTHLAVLQTLGDKIPEQMRRFQVELAPENMVAHLQASLDPQVLVRSETYQVERQPRGWFEQVRSLFGTQFMETRTDYCLNEASLSEAVKNSVREAIENSQSALGAQFASITATVTAEIHRLEAAARQESERRLRLAAQSRQECEAQLEELNAERTRVEQLRRELEHALASVG